MRARMDRRNLMARLRAIHRRIETLEAEAECIEKRIGPRKFVRLGPRTVIFTERDIIALLHMEPEGRRKKLRGAAEKHGVSIRAVYNWLARHSRAWQQRQRDQ